MRSPTETVPPPITAPPHSPYVADSATPTVTTDGLAPGPAEPPQNQLTPGEATRLRGLASRAGTCTAAQATTTLDKVQYVGCDGGLVVALDAQGRVMASTRVSMEGINWISVAGSNALVVEGWNDGAALENDLSILRSMTLKPIVHHRMTDTTYLGTIEEQAYMDDWCCHGRPDVYQPATIYSISLEDGSESEHVSLAPDPQLHKSREPLGQGGRNYLVGTRFYVVVGDVTYEYDVDNLSKAPKRLATAPTPSAERPGQI